MERRPLSAAKKVERKILRSNSPNTLWTVHSFPSLPSDIVARILSRLAANGTIKRVRKGIYYRPIETLLGPSIPDPIAVAKAVAQIKGRNVVLGGYTAYNALGITTQVAGKVTLITNKSIKSPATKNKHVRLIERPVYSTMMPEERSILDALRDINRISDTSPTKIVARIVKLIRSKKLSFGRLVHFALRNEPPRVRALLGIIGESIKAPKSLLNLLYRSLNSTTTFKIRIDPPFNSAQEWRMAG